MKQLNNFKYTLDTCTYTKENLPSGYTDYFPTAYYLLDVRLKNSIKEALEKYPSVEVHLVVPKKGKICGWFITHKGAYIAFKGRFNYIHDRKVRWAVYKYCGEFAYFFDEVKK